MPTITISSLSGFLDRANALNNAFQSLWKQATYEQKLILDPYMDGFVRDYNRWRDSTFPGLLQYTEYGKIEEWEKTYSKLREQFKAERAPVITPGKVFVPEEIKVVTPTKKETKETVEIAIKSIWDKVKTPLLITSGVVMLGTAGYIYYRSK